MFELNKVRADEDGGIEGEEVDVDIKQVREHQIHPDEDENLQNVDAELFSQLDLGDLDEEEVKK